MADWVLVALKKGAGRGESKRHGKFSYGVGDVVLLPPHLEHQLATTADGDGISQWVHMRFTLPGGLDVSEFLDVPILAPKEKSARLIRLVRQLGAICQGGRSSSIAAAAKRLELGCAILSGICDVSTERRPLSTSLDDERIRDVLIFVESHLADNLDRDLLAKRCHLSPARFHTVFSAVVGRSPVAHVRELRMRRACWLLSDTNRCVKQVGRAVGYDDPYTFSRAFRATVGQSPAQYRIQVRRSTAGT
jgi:AraC-like DNA-binding protein